MISTKKAIELISRGTEEILVEEELKKKLDSGKKLNVKAGFDPTAPDLHLGHTVIINKMRQFQEFGNEIIQSGSSMTVWGADDAPQTPVYPNLTNGTIFEESDTGKIYMFDGTDTWNEVA